MANFACDCPYCKSKRTNFTLRGVQKLNGNVPKNEKTQISFVAFCGNCNGGIAGIAWMRSDLVDTFEMHAKAFNTTIYNFVVEKESIDSTIEIVNVFPETPKPNVPQYLPENIHKIYTEAEDLRLNKHYSAAGSHYRKVLEATTIHLDPDLKKRENFYNRINKLEASDLLTKEIREWMHEIRLFGNETVHDPDSSPERNEVEEAADCTRMILIYLFELPEKIKLLRKNKTNKSIFWKWFTKH